MKTFTSGAKSSEESPRYDLVPLASLKRQAARMAQGAATHGEHNYRKGAADPTFIRDRINHLLGHALAYAAGDRSDDHLGAVLANAGMLADIESMQPASITNERPTYDERRSDLKPCKCGAIFTHPHLCDANEKCMAACHPHHRQTLADQRSRNP
jgi:hypothetical protein